ncbi:MAG TPA: ABC transporter permease [Acidobacteriaceae bacterium]|nr:ABC transporter permease [Acidobacteriaceae bacterium]
MSLMRRIRNLGRRERVDAEIAEELAAHIELAVEEAARNGASEEEARRAARLRFGNPVAVREKTAGADVALLLDTLTRDARIALRQLRRSPGFALAAVLTLGLGIGANTAIFSLVEGILLRPLPYQHPERLVVIWQTTPEHRATGAYFNMYRQFEAFQQSSRSFERMSAMSWADGMRSGPVRWKGKPVEMLAFPASLDFFSTLGVSAQMGRTFAPADLNAACTVVLAHAFWQNKLGAPANIAGQTLDFDDASCRVVGVMPRSFSFYPTATDAWMLITPSSAFATQPWHSITGIFGLLKPGVTRAAAEAELAAIEERILPEAPKADTFLRDWRPDVIPLHDNFTWLTGRNLRRGLWLLLGASGVILLLACANLGSLLQGRNMGRSRELAVRLALGAGRGRLAGQLMTESLLLATGGAVAGVALAAALLRWFVAVSPIPLPPGAVLAVDWRVLLFAAAAGMLCLMLFGLAPARHASGTDPNAALKTGGAAGVTRAALRNMQALVVVQVALSMMLVASAGLLAKSLWNLVATNVGYRTEHVFSAEIYRPKKRYADTGDVSRLAAQLMPDLSSLPQAESVAFASGYLPMGGARPLALEGRHAPEHDQPTAIEQDVGATYFATLGIPVLRGRGFDDRDQEKTQAVAMINEALAKRYFAGTDPIGHAIQLGSDGDAAPRWLKIVGITADVKTTTVFQEMGYVENPVVYRPLTQVAPQGLALLVATRGRASNLAGDVQQRLAAHDRDLELTDIDGLSALRADGLSQPRFRTVAFEGFATLALALALVGLYGVLAQMVLRQRREIGIRMALGANRSLILCAVLGQASMIAAIGVVCGTCGAAAAARLLRGLLYGIRAEGALEFACAAGAMLVVAAITAWIPARRAASADPAEVLRAE